MRFLVPADLRGKSARFFWFVLSLFDPARLVSAYMGMALSNALTRPSLTTFKSPEQIPIGYMLIVFGLFPLRGMDVMVDNLAS